MMLMATQLATHPSMTGRMQSNADGQPYRHTHWSVVAGLAWFMSMKPAKSRSGFLLNKTREEYATKDDLRNDMRNVMDALHRVEDKLDKALSRGT
jgi:hypothetical protein